MGFLVHIVRRRSGRRLLNIYFAAEAAAALVAVRKVLYNSVPTPLCAHYTLPLLLLKRQQYKTNHTSTLHYIHYNTLPVDYHFSEFLMQSCLHIKTRALCMYQWCCVTELKVPSSETSSNFDGTGTELVSFQKW